MKKKYISIIGLGYVGLPLAVEFAKFFDVIAFDYNSKRINELRNNLDENNEIKKNELKKLKKLYFTENEKDLKKSNIFIIAVPTPIKKNKKPNLIFLKQACITVSKYISKKDIVIFESTVYPGLTDDYCIPIIEKYSKFKINKDFFCGYSPERINPGDKKNKLSTIVKITSGSNYKTSIFVDNLYKKIIKAGTYRTSSIKIAEAAKVIENTQRDLNIAFINELSIIFNKLHLDTDEILKAASTKWNFIKFSPGLVGGHCIGVDPYYLTYKAKKVGYSPKIILSGRDMNDNMVKYVSKRFLNKLSEKKIKIINSQILILGFSFKENCSDTRNSKIKDLHKLLIRK